LRYIGVTFCGLVWLAAAFLLITTDWSWLTADGTAVGPTDSALVVRVEGDGLGGRIGMDPLADIAFCAFLGMLAGFAAEAWVRHRTERRRRRGEPWWMHT
jgi:hypothetical protein